MAACRLLALVLAFLSATATASAQAPDPTVEWRKAAIADLNAARDLLRDSHPAAVPSLGRTAFTTWLDRGHAEGLARAETVTDFAGYLAVLGAYANGFRDSHVRARPTQERRSFQWPGFLVGLKNGRWIVMDRDETVPGVPALGAELLDCDGRTPDAIAWERLGVFSVDWSVEAQRVSAAPSLLIDAGNPFVRRPTDCVVAEGGTNRHVALSWRPIAVADLAPRIRKAAPASRPGFGLRQVGDGWWIALQSLSDEAGPVLDAVQAEIAAIRKAPFVVVDLRGNGGGNSLWTSRLAALLYGQDHTRARALRQDGDCGIRWRVSAGNLATVEAYRERMASAMDAARAEDAFGTIAAAMRKAGASGQELVPSPGGTCTGTPPADAGTPPRTGPLVLLVTDHACFSSCLIATEEFRRLGAVHVGRPTNRGEAFMEVREATLPSGHATFATMQSYAPVMEGRLGPFIPRHLFPGDITDTEALELWVVGQMVPWLRDR